MYIRTFLHTYIFKLCVFFCSVFQLFIAFLTEKGMVFKVIVVVVVVLVVVVFVVAQTNTKQNLFFLHIKSNVRIQLLYLL